jgi:hypothetical protein
MYQGSCMAAVIGGKGTCYSICAKRHAQAARHITNAQTRQQLAAHARTRLSLKVLKLVQVKVTTYQ